MKHKKVLKRMAYLVIIIIISGLSYKSPYMAKADVIDDSESRVNIVNSSGKVVATITMKKGEIIVIAQSQSGSTSIKWGSIGFTITRQPLREKNYTYRAEEGNYYLKGYENINTVYDSGYGELMFSSGNKTSVTDPRTGITTATIKFTASQVEAALGGEKFSNITKNTPIYLHGIFRTYSVDKNGNEINRKNNIKNWMDILLAEWWDRSDNRLDEFAKYYNMQIEFQPAKQKNTLYYYTDDNEKIDQKELAAAFPGEEVSWSSVPAEQTYKDKQYELYKYVVESKKGKEIETHFIGDSHSGKPSCKLENIQSGKTIVTLGGMNIKLYYKEKSGAKIIIRAVDQKSNTVIKDKLYEGTVTGGQNFNQQVDNVINYNGKSYSKLKNFSYEFKNNNNITKTVSLQTNKPEDSITFQIPSDIQNSSTITVTVYYNEAQAGTIPITVKAINKKTGAEIKILTTGTVSAGTTYNYTVSETLTQDDKTYDFTGEWKWQYKKNTSSAPIVTNTGSGTNVSFKAPSADEIKDEITVYVHYKVSDIPTDEISLRVIMVSRVGALIEEISRETVSRGQAISKSIQNSRTVRGITYQYQHKWDYTYHTSSGDTTKIGSGTSASFTIPSNTKLGTVVTLKLYYDLIQEVVIPDPAPPIVLPIDSPSPQGIINGDKYLASYFHSKDGISTTESQYVTVRTREYLLGYRLVNKTGKVTFVVPITMTYTLEYFTATPEEFGGPQPVTDTVADTQYIAVERAYSYWEIESLEYYHPSTANIYNYSLPEGGVNLSSNSSFLSVPNLTTRHSSNRDNHIVLPIQAVEGIVLEHEEPIRSETSDRPWIEYEDLTAYAYEMTDELLVKNDYLNFNGSTVMTDSYEEIITQTPNIGSMYHSTRMTHDKVLFTEGKVIDALKKNGVYPSNGNVTYARHPMSINASSSKLFNMSVNDVIIHTPVICDPKVYSDNDKYVQLLKPTEGAYHMVLDPDNELNDFTVRISNKLNHSYRMGYYERDFSRSFIDPENISYIAKAKGIVRNEMKLPFDVYIDTLNDKDPKNDDFIKSGTWIVLGRETYRFYVPMWVQEGTYTAQFRSIAVNGEDKLSNTEDTRNTNLNNYVATATKTFQISGRMYGLTLYDVSDEGRWRDAFRIKDSIRFKYFEGETDGTKRTSYHDDYAYYYTVGIKNQYGYQNGRYERFTFPLLNGSHPRFNNVGALKTGYAFRFRLDTIGEMYGAGCKVRIIPTFYHVDAKGKNRQQVDIYYDEEFYNKSHYLVKIGQGIDLANLQQGTVGNTYSNIPERELRNTANVMQTTYDKIRYQYGTMYSYSDIRITSQFRTFIGTDYASHIASLPSFNKVKEQVKETELNLSKYMQRWYGTYKLPTNIHAVPSGYDVKDHLRKYGIDYHEDFWLKDGYIIVNFSIETYDKNGNKHLSYTNGENYLNNGLCSMWVMEGGNTEKTDNTGAKFRLYAGDVVFYFTSKKHSDDYMGRLW